MGKNISVVIILSKKESGIGVGYGFYLCKVERKHRGKEGRKKERESIVQISSGEVEEKGGSGEVLLAWAAWVVYS